MCAKCEEVRGPVADEVVRRTGATRETVIDVLRALEDMTIEANEMQEKREQEARSAITAALAGDREQAIETIRGLFGGNAEVHVIEIGPDGTPEPAPAHERDVQEPRLPGMYL